jgi:hypothetical protein
LKACRYEGALSTPGDGRWPTLQWPREVPLSGDPADVHQRIADYSAWLQVASLPKLFIDAEPGVFITGRVRKLACSFPTSNSEKTQARADLVGWDRTYRIPQATDIVVNATSIGLFPHVEGRLDLDLDSLRPGLVVADVIPNPPRTQLIRDAEARGCIVLDGLGMLVNQGAVSIRHWTGIDPETEVMRRKLEKIFGV